MRISFLAGVATLTLTMLVGACGDDPEPATNVDESDVNVGESDAGMNPEPDADGADASVECGPTEAEFEGACVSRGLDLQATVLGDEFYNLEARPFEVLPNESPTETPINDNCSIVTQTETEAPELPTCYDAGLLTVTSSASADPLEIGYLQECYSSRPENFASAGDELTVAFAGGADSGPVTLSGILPETPVIEVTSEPDGGLTFVTTNPNPEASLFLNFVPETRNGTTVACNVPDGATLELSADDVTEIESLLDTGTSFASFALSDQATADGTYISLTLFSFQYGVYSF